MLRQTHRFHGRGSLRYVYTHGKTVRTPQLALRYILNDRRKVFRCAVVVAKKVNKSAVTRNRIRRRLYEIVRQEANSINKPYDMVVTVFDDRMADAPPDALRQTVQELLARSGIVAKDQ